MCKIYKNTCYFFIVSILLLRINSDKVVTGTKSNWFKAEGNFKNFLLLHFFLIEQGPVDVLWISLTIENLIFAVSLDQKLIPLTHIMEIVERLLNTRDLDTQNSSVTLEFKR